MSIAISSCVRASRKSNFGFEGMFSASIEDNEVTEEPDPYERRLSRLCNAELTSSDGSNRGVEMPELLSLISESSAQLASGNVTASIIGGSSKFPPCMGGTKLSHLPSTRPMR